MIFLDKSERQNKAYVYIAPMLFAAKEDLWDKVLVNVYVGDKNVPDLSNNIFLVYVTEESTRFSNLLSYYRKHQDFEMEYDYDKYRVFAFKVPKHQQRNYNYFLSGKYSSFDDKYKKHIIDFHSINMNNSVCDVLYKRENRYKMWEEILGIDYLPRTLDTSSIYDEKFEVIGNLYKLEEINE